MINHQIRAQRMTRRRFLAAATAALAAGPALGRPARAAYAPAALSPPVSVKVLQSPILAQSPLFIAQERGYFREEGIAIESIPGNVNASDALVMLNTGNLDMLPAAPSASLFNAVSRGVEFTILMSMVNNFKGDTSPGLVVRKALVDSGRYKGYANLKGMKVGVFSTASTSDFFVGHVLENNGLRYEDVDFTVLPFPEMAAALTNGALDAAWLAEPFITNMQKQGVIQLLISGGDLVPGFPTGLILASKPLAAQKPDVAQRFITATLRGQRDYHNAIDLNRGGHDQIFAILSKYTGANLATLNSIGLSHVDPNGDFDTSSVDRLQDFFLKRGVMQKKVELSGLIDRRFLQKAQQLLT